MFRMLFVKVHYYGVLPQLPHMVFAAVTPYKEAELSEDGEELHKKTYIRGFSVMAAMPVEPYHEREVIFINVANITRNVVHMSSNTAEGTLRMIALMIDDRVSVDKSRLEVTVPIQTPQNRQQM